MYVPYIWFLAAVLIPSCVLHAQTGRGESPPFRYTPAMEPDAVVARRDPSDVLKAGGEYYVWYTKSLKSDDGFPTGYPGTLWYASSGDGIHWEERGMALGRGAPGAWDEHGVFTPNILAAEGKYYLFYTGVPEPFSNTYAEGPTPTAIGAAVADSPHGPWRRSENNPVLKPGPEDSWENFRVDDACLLTVEGKFYLYYKGVDFMEDWWTHTPMGVAIARNPEGPYVKYAGNPLIETGHEVLVWRQGNEFAAMAWRDGVWFGKDGLAFGKRIPLAAEGMPQAPGGYRAESAMKWGISQRYVHLKEGQTVYLERFEFELELEE